MNYDTQIENGLKDLKNDEIRITNDITSKKYIHDNQIAAAKEIVKSFTAHLPPENQHNARNNHVVLVAKMQSGKTGTCNAVINILEKTKYNSYFKIDKYFYITGMNDNGLHKQTVYRLSSDEEGQVIDANFDNVCDGDKETREKPHAKYFVQKNSDLRKNNIKLSNCVIFIDESHFGSNKINVLTKFLEENGINWKNNNILKNKNIYIVSVSATPYDEIVSDIVDCKTIVTLETNEMYIGVSEYLDNDCILNADRFDFRKNRKTGKIPIIEYIKEIYEKIKENDNKGVLFIRTRDSKIKNDKFIKSNFKKVEIEGNINYEEVYDKTQSMIDSISGSETNKPIIFFIKGAYRAGITLDQQHKDYVYMVYDNSSKAEATAQGLLGRMCGYRNTKSNFDKTIFYINRQHAEDYAEWEEDFKLKNNIPTTKNWDWVSDDYEVYSNDYFINVDKELPKSKKSTNIIGKLWNNLIIECKFIPEKNEFVSLDNNPLDIIEWKYSDMKIATKGNGNFEIPLEDKDILRFIDAGLNKDVNNKDFTRNELRLLKPDFNFDYLGEAYINGRNKYNSSNTITKWFDKFDVDDSCPSYRPDSLFKLKNKGRDFLSIKEDLGKIICHVVLDSNVDNNRNISGNKRLIIYHGILSKKCRIKKEYIIEHKNTN